MRAGPLNPYDYPTFPNSMALPPGATCGQCVHFGLGQVGACGKSPRRGQDYCAWRPKRFQKTEPKPKAEK